MEPVKILILCTGNSCRSQMAEGFLKSFNKNFLVYSAGTVPEKKVNPYAVKVMQEKEIDISSNKTNNVSEFLSQDFDFVVTVCNSAKNSCPAFTGKAKNRLHIGFDDPAHATGTDEEILRVYRKVRDEIYVEFEKFYLKIEDVRSIK